MATLNANTRKARRRKKYICGLILFLFLTVLFVFLSYFLFDIIKNGFHELDFNFKVCITSLFKESFQMKIFGYLEIMDVLLVFYMITYSEGRVGKSDVMKVTDNISIPVAVGEGQHGTSRFLNQNEKNSLFALVEKESDKEIVSDENLGLVVGMDDIAGKKERLYCVSEDIHTIILGTTRSGKTRCMILESIWLRAATGNSMIISDPKGELFLYTHEYLKNRGYEVIDLDLRQPFKGKHYNYLDMINEAVDANDIPKAIDRTWDLTSVLVGVPKGEPLWQNGEAAVIASGIMAVVLDAPKECRNLCNVYYFISNMCEANELGDMYINKYFDSLPDTHPAKGIFAVAKISPSRTRGSFFGSALATLRLFTNWNIADMTSFSDFELKEVGKEKTALFIIIPDEKVTFYSLVSLFINQAYIALVELANGFGGRIPKDVDFFMDEFGNFPAIPSFGSMLSVGAGRGLRFSLVLQDFQQLEKNYKEDSETIKGNCQLLVYLKSSSVKTLEEISKKTGTYTVQVNSANSSISGKTLKNSSFSDSANMQSRRLLLPDEVGRIERPYSLVLYTGKYPGIFHAPDLLKYFANEELGMGDKKHNQELMMKRDNERKCREIHQPVLWEIWKKYKKLDENLKDQEPKTEKISFLK